MINHARTLLMNVDGSAPLTAYLAEEVVDPDYRAVDFPTPIDQVRRALFGADPDRHMLNYRCRELLAAVHASPLAGYVTALDPRVTYRFDDPAVVDPATWTPAVTPLAGAGTLTVLGEAAPPDATGRLYHKVLVTVTSPGVVEMERLTAPLSKPVLNFSAGDQLPLAGTGHTVRIPSAASGQQWTVEVYARPRRGLVELAAAASGLGEPVYLYLFGTTRAEPYLTFGRLWRGAAELAPRVAGLVCALAYRSEEVRRG